MWSVKTTPVTPKIVEVEKIVEIKKYVDVNYADIDERRFSQELRRRWYVSFDGYQIWLAANEPDNRVVALEPSVFSN